MKRIHYTLTSLSPLLLSTGSEDANASSTLDYIPGRILQGVMANTWIKQENLQEAHTDADFYRYILQGEIIFTPAYIQHQGQGRQPSYPLPFSIQKEKGTSSKAIDVLVSEEDKPTQSLNGFGYVKQGKLYTCSPARSLHFHHNGQEGKKDPLPFTYEALDAHQSFQGFIIGEEAALKKIQKYLSQKTIHIGRSRSAQYGKAALQLSEPMAFENDANTSVDDIKSLKADPEGKNPFYLSFLSDTLIYDAGGNASTDRKALKRYLGEGIEIKNAMLRSVVYQSFQGNWNLKRPDEVCIQAGSTLELTLTDVQAIPHLLALMHKGLGEKTGEGLGRVVVGLQEQEAYSLVSHVANNASTIPEQCPDFAQGLLKGVLLKKVQRACYELAIKESAALNAPTRLPKSLISRLDSTLQSQSVEQFQRFVSGLKGKPAGDALQRLRFKKYNPETESLWDVLKQSPPLEQLLTQNAPHEMFAKETKISLQALVKENHESLEKHYYQTLLHQLKSAVKQNKKQLTQEAHYA